MLYVHDFLSESENSHVIKRIAKWAKKHADDDEVKEATHDIDYWSQFVEEAADDKYLNSVTMAAHQSTIDRLTAELAEIRILLSHSEEDLEAELAQEKR
jgi:hypothetical protein